METKVNHATDGDRFVTRQGAAELLSMSAAYLAKLACYRRGPRFTKFGEADRSPVRYRVADVLAWARDPAGHELAVWGETETKNGKGKA